MSEIIHTSSRGTVELFEENEAKRIRRTVNSEMPLYETLKKSECKYIPKIYSVDIVEGKTVVTEEFISGENLLTANQDEKQVIRAMIQLCAALDFIHSLGIVHRDIKPSNILLSDDGDIRLIDFEAARFVNNEKDRDTRYLGTDGFAPPEQYGFAQTDLRTDIYAAGQTMKVLLGSLSAKRKYAKIIRRCTALDPAERYQSAKALSDALINKKNKIFLPAAFAATTAVLIFAVLLPKGIPAEKITYETTLSEETETVFEETAFSETETAAETVTAYRISEASEAKTPAETVTASQTSETENTPKPETAYAAETTYSTKAASETVITDEYGYPLDPARYDPDVIEKYIAQKEEGLTFYGIPENLPDYEREDLLFFPPQETEEYTKILFTSGKALFKEHMKYYMYFDMDDDGVNEAVCAYADPRGNLDISITYGLPDKNYGVHVSMECLHSEYLTYYDHISVDENCFLQITCFKNPNDKKYVAVTVGDGKTFNVTEVYDVKNGEVDYAGCGWGETTAVMYGLELDIYFDGGGQNLYSLCDGTLSAVNELDYEEYQKILDGEYSLDEIHEMIARKPEGY